MGRRRDGVRDGEGPTNRDEKRAESDRSKGGSTEETEKTGKTGKTERKNKTLAVVCLWAACGQLWKTVENCGWADDVSWACRPCRRDGRGGEEQ
jgi:hypothetical protein